MITTETTEWGLQDVWNESIDLQEPRKFEPRDYLYATEVGSSFLDTYLKLKGVQPSNPFDIRSKRKFDMGNFIEWTMKLVLIRAGILKATQERVGSQYPGCLRVSGRLDYRAGGMIDWEKAKADVDELVKIYELPEFLANIARNIVLKFSERYPAGMEEVVIEMKSSSSFMFFLMERTKLPDPKHVNQCFHYIKGKGFSRGIIAYLCKDDARLLEFNIYNNEENEATYKAWIEKMSYYYLNNIEPPKEKELDFDVDKGRFGANWKVGYSPYLTLNYGYKNQSEFDDKYRPLAEKWNRVLLRAVEVKYPTPTREKPMALTKLNLEVIEEVKSAGFDWDSAVEIAKSKGLPDESEVIIDAEK